MPTGEQVRAAQRATWAGLSTSWEKWDAVIMAQLRPVTTAMTGLLEVAVDQQHLDVASGTGEPGLTVARLAPQGSVVLTDLSPEMLDVAGRRAGTQGITNVRTAVCSADDLPFEDAAFDSVSARFGLMFFPDVPAATAELVRVLKPGGRLCASVWVDPEQNPWTSVVMQAVGAEVELPKPEPDAPSMFRCAAPGYVTALFEDAGLRDVRERDVPVALVTRSPEEFWEVMSEHVSLAAAALTQVDEPARERIASAVVGAARGYEQDGAVRLPGLARCVVGRKPAQPAVTSQR
jgi:SAM-dependent methyltransferase